MSSYVGEWNLPTTWAIDFRQLVITVDGTRYGIPQRRSLQGVPVWQSLDAGERENVARTMAASRFYRITRDDITVLCRIESFPDDTLVRFFRMAY